MEPLKTSGLNNRIAQPTTYTEKCLVCGRVYAKGTTMVSGEYRVDYPDRYEFWREWECINCFKHRKEAQQGREG